MTPMRSYYGLVTGLALVLWGGLAWGHMADLAGGKVDQPVLYLGKIAVTGQENIVRTLQAIKIAMKAPFSVAPADADKVVCRINKTLGEAIEYLDCATNRDYIQRRTATQMQILTSSSQADQCGGNCAAYVRLHNMLSLQPQHRLHVPINGGNFQKLLDSIPLPAATTAASPAGATGSAGGSGGI